MNIKLSVLATVVTLMPLTSAMSADVPCGHPDSKPTALQRVKIEEWKEPRLIEEFRNFGRAGEYTYYDGPAYEPVPGKPGEPKIFKYWEIKKAFEAPDKFIALQVRNFPGDGVYTLEIFHCGTAQAWEGVWKSFMDKIDADVVVEKVS